MDANQALPSAPFLLLGLGNPGREYRQNRHNIGFMALDRLAERLNISFNRVESKSLVCKGDYEGRRVLLAKPQTFMNLSGTAAGALLRYYKIPLEQFMVIYDDVDLDFGVIRLRPDGGSAGQKGMQSILERIGTQTFPRLRLGIGRPPGRMEAADYVLQDFSRQEAELLPALLDRATDAIFAFVKYDLNTAMNQYNG
jgi:PTH1 family peptidyl-tRNA hydrolase